MDYSAIKRNLSPERLTIYNRLHDLVRQYLSIKDNILYLGAGTDIESILLITHGRYITLVDKEHKNQDIYDKLIKLYPALQITQKSNEITVFKEKRFLFKLTMIQSTYIDFVHDCISHDRQYGMIFDKKSMIEQCWDIHSQPHLLTKLLRVYGFWLGEYWSANLPLLQMHPHYQQYIDVQLIDDIKVDERPQLIIRKVNAEPTDMRNYELFLDYITLTTPLYKLKDAIESHHNFLTQEYEYLLISLASIFSRLHELNSVQKIRNFEKWMLGIYGNYIRIFLQKLIDRDELDLNNQTDVFNVWLKCIYTSHDSCYQ